MHGWKKPLVEASVAVEAPGFKRSWREVETQDHVTESVSPKRTQEKLSVKAGPVAVDTQNFRDASAMR